MVSARKDAGHELEWEAASPATSPEAMTSRRSMDSRMAALFLFGAGCCWRGRAPRRWRRALPRRVPASACTPITLVPITLGTSGVYCPGGSDGVGHDRHPVDDGIRRGLRNV